MSLGARNVGVVVPVRGWAPYLAETLDCVLREAPGEVVVVDDASEWPLELHPDHLAAGVRLVRSERRLRLPGARNHGVAALGPDAELVAFCDGDDAWEAGSLGAKVKALADAPWAAGAFGSARIVGPDGRRTGERWSSPPAGRFDDLEGLYSGNPFPVSSVVVRRAAFPGFDETYRSAEDWELWLRMANAGAAWVSVPEAVVRYRRHSHAMSRELHVLAAAMADLHEAHADAVTPALLDQALRADRRGEAEGWLRAGNYDRARSLMEPGLRRAILRVPGLRGLLGRRDPYRRG